MKKKHSLNIEIWKYLIIFSILILAFIWIFQIIFLNKFYEIQKTKDIEKTATKIVNATSINELKRITSDASIMDNVCIEITDNNKTLYSSDYFNGCLKGNEATINYKGDFISSGKNKMKYKIINPIFNNKTLIYALKSEDLYVFINTSLEPMDNTIKILKNQFIYVTILVFILSFVIAYFISSHISKPIISINKVASQMSRKELNVVFDSNSSIKEIEELSNTLNHTRDELVKTEELRRDLMANVSHDLKTPLTMIKAYAEMSRDLHSNNKKKRNENLNIIIEEADRLTILVNDILTLSKMQTNIEQIKYEEFSLVELVNSILKRYKVLQEKDGYNFIFEYDSDINIFADKKKLEQVIYNLVNNAINYTGNDKTVIIKLIDRKESIRVEIIDSGNGIDKTDLPYIWDKYYRSEKKYKRNVIGTGIGLSIVKEILTMHNYKYGVESEKDKGTTFYFEIKKASD